MLSTSRLSKLSGLSQSFIFRIESGEKQPTLETLRKLAQGLGISLGELLGEEMLSEPQSPKISRIIGNIRKLPVEQVDALDLFLASLSSSYAVGENPLTVQAINLKNSAGDGFEMEVVFSSNVSAIMEHRIPDGTNRNMAGFHLYDGEMKEIPIEIISGSKKMLGQRAERIFVIKPQIRLTDGRFYKLTISKLLQANNYKYLKENHTILFTTREIVDITPYNKKLCSPYLSLALEKSNINSGDENIPVNTEIRLTFSNNVITRTVRDNNLHCFSLRSSKNQIVEIDVIMGDPDDNSDKKKEIVIRPQQHLLANTLYILTISENLQGGNQKLLGRDKAIIFTTDETGAATAGQGGVGIA
ncbi:XRE family transcriptional regulator [Desulfitobacterium hafniense]|uniref:XRE family transcriptional regulator n=2 Tax=Desulfitobacterium hafniense TaxID=49338 RepID=A0A0W1JDU2_DESHA|nr:XRE family transcriptional regulator [Desulfitobacterium hafniense]